MVICVFLIPYLNVQAKFVANRKTTSIHFLHIPRGKKIGDGVFMEVKPTTKIVIKITRFHHQTMIKLGLFSP